MPVVAVIGAVVAIGVAVEVGTTLAVIAAVGATIGAVGAVTGNKTLSMVGGIIGAVGAIGAIASSAGLLPNLGQVWSPGSISGMFGDAASATATAAASPGLDAAGNPTMSGAAAPNIDAEIAQWSQYGQNSDIINEVAGTMQPLESAGSPSIAGADAPDVTPVAAGETSGVQNTTMSNAPMTDPATGQVIQGDMSGVVTAPGVDAPTAPTATAGDASKVTGIPEGFDAQGNVVAPGSAGATPSTEGLINAGSGTNAAGTSITRVTPDTGIWSSIKDLIKTPGGGRLLSGVIQAGSSFIAGATNGLTPAQIAALNAQAEANNANAARQRQETANMQGPLPVATRTPPVTGAPQGMINTPAAPRIPVTGAV